MKTIVIKIGLFFAFCILSAIIIACTQEFAISMVEDSEPLQVTSDITGVSGFQVVTGYRDSLSLAFIEISDTNVSLAKKGTAGLDSLRSRVNRIRLTFNEVIGAVGYEVRVSREAIQSKNWIKAQLLEFVNVAINSGAVYGEAVLSTKPEVKSGSCIGCGTCEISCPAKAISTKSGKAIIDYEKCIKCGQCFRNCPYDAIEGSFAGTPYFIAIRPYRFTNGIKEYSEAVSCTPEAYVVQYTTLASIPDSNKIRKINFNGNIIDLHDDAGDTMFVHGCVGNCNFTGCFIVNIKSTICSTINGKRETADTSEAITVCPVDAVYTVGTDTAAITFANTVRGAMFIDKEKCIDCGRCLTQCQWDGRGAVTTEVVKAASRFVPILKGSAQ